MSNEVSIEFVEEITEWCLGDYIPGPKGEQGDPGPAGGSVVTATAGQNLSSGRAVVSINNQIVYFNPADESHAGLLYGITKTAALTGQSVEVQLSGLFNETGLGFTPNQIVYAGASGVLTHTPPASGLIQQVGPAISANALSINITLTVISI
ncbi:MAG TPA: DUF2190 family protein [Saprospiraceae bacterium]|nr:DUF2190 family protein [Saprospiraceae bacterium]